MGWVVKGPQLGSSCCASASHLVTPPPPPPRHFLYIVSNVLFITAAFPEPCQHEWLQTNITPPSSGVVLAEHCFFLIFVLKNLIFLFSPSLFFMCIFPSFVTHIIFSRWLVTAKNSSEASDSRKSLVWLEMTRRKLDLVYRLLTLQTCQTGSLCVTDYM